MNRVGISTDVSWVVIRGGGRGVILPSCRAAVGGLGEGGLDELSLPLCPHRPLNNCHGPRHECATDRSRVRNGPRGPRHGLCHILTSPWIAPGRGLALAV